MTSLGKSCRVAVCISGGGAKGAFAQGVLEAFPDDIEISATAGTSIGGLTAAALGTQQVEEARGLWTRLTPWKLLRPAGIPGLGPLSMFFQFVCLIPGVVVVLLNVALECFQQRGTYLSAQGVPVRTLRMCVIAVIGVLTYLCVGLILTRLEASLSAGFTTIAIVSLYRWRNLFTPILAGSLATGLTFFGIGSLFDSCLFRITLIYAASGVSVSMWLLAIAVFRQQFTLMPWRPIRDMVTPFARTLPSIPTYICTARLTEAIRIDRVFDQIIEEPQPAMARLYTLNSFLGFVFRPILRHDPCYIDLRGVAQFESRLDYICSTAALPVGLIGSVRIQDGSYEDGGIVDNTPILPLLEHVSGLDALVVIRLDPIRGNNGPLSMCTSVGQAIATHVLQAELDAVIRARHEVELLRRLKRRLQFAGAFIPTVEDHVPLERARIERVVEELRTSLDEEAQEIRSRLLNTKVLTIAPDNQLGGFVSGTLNFSPSAIARWQSLGRDMGTTIIDTVSFVTVRDALRTMQLGAPGDV